MRKENVTKELDKCNKAKDKCLDLYMDDMFTKDELSKRVSKLDEEIRTLKNRLVKDDISMNLKNKQNIEETIPY